MELASFVGSSSLLADFGITAAGAGLLVGIYFPLYGLMQIPSGIAADLSRPRAILMAGGVLTGLTTLALALSPSLPLAIAARGATGLASGVLWLSALKLYSRLPGVSYARAVSVLVAVGSAGTLLGLVAVPVAVTGWPWRLVAALTGVPPLLVCLLLARTPTGEAASVPAANAGAGTAHERASRRFLPVLRESWRGVVRVAATREHWVVFLPTMLWNGANFAIVGWLPRYGRDALGLPVAAVGALPALLPLGQMAGSTLIGMAQGRPRARPAPPAGKAGSPLPLFFGCIVAYGVLFTLLLSGELAPLGLVGVSVAALLMGVSYGAFFLSQTYLAARVEPALLGTATGVLNALGFLPAFVYSWLVGVVLDLVDRPTTSSWTYSPGAFRVAFLVLDAGLAVGLLGALALRRAPREQVAPGAVASSEAGA